MHLRIVADGLVQRRASEEEVVRLLGPSQHPSREKSSETKGLIYIYDSSPPGGPGGYMSGIEIVIRQGQAVEARPWSMHWRGPAGGDR